MKPKTGVKTGLSRPEGISFFASNIVVF